MPTRPIYPNLAKIGFGTQLYWFQLLSSTKRRMTVCMNGSSGIFEVDISWDRVGHEYVPVATLFTPDDKCQVTGVESRVPKLAVFSSPADVFALVTGVDEKTC